MLFSDESNIIYKDESLNWLFENKQLFITKQCLQTFGKYAISKIKKSSECNQYNDYSENDDL